MQQIGKHTKVKICGIRTQADVACVNSLLPEYIGLMFYPKSPRFITHFQAAELKACLDPAIQSVGVFLDNDLSEIEELLNEHLLDAVQLHGPRLDETVIRRLREITDVPIIRAFRIETAEDVTRACESSADYILLDSGAGGTGVPFDWNCIRDVQRPFFLAGGLHPGNVEEAVKRFHPYAVDVSSGVESAPGRKDSEKIKAFLRVVRNACGEI